MGKIDPNHRVRPKSAKYWYSGILRTDKLPKGDVKTAYQSWLDQRQRCGNSSNSSFKWYGAKGIRVIYSSREFVAWWLEELKGKTFDKAVCGRIDHNSNYEFGNITLQESKDNALDVHERHPHIPYHSSRKVVVLRGEDEYLLAVLPTIKKAADLTGVDISNVQSLCTKFKHRFGKGFKFRYYEDYIGNP